MDIVRRLKHEFSGNALEDVADQVRVYVKERHEAADEIEQLRKDKAELLEALKFYACDCQCLDGCSIADCGDVARKAIAKTTGGK